MNFSYITYIHAIGSTILAQLEKRVCRAFYVSGYYVYKVIWAIASGEELMCDSEPIPIQTGTM